MTQVDWTVPLDPNERYVAMVERLQAMMKAIRSGHASATVVPDDLEDYEIFADLADLLFKYKSADAADEFVALWKLESGPWATIPHSMGETGTIPSAADVGTGAGATYVTIDGLSSLATITLPSLGDTRNKHRLIVVERRDASSNGCILSSSSNLEPIGVSSLSIALDPGDVIGLTSTNGTTWTIAFEHRNPTVSKGSGSPYAMTWADRNVLINGSSAITLPPPAEFKRYEASFVNIHASAAGTINPNASETINGASSLSLPSQWDRAKLITDGTDWFRMA